MNALKTLGGVLRSKLLGQPVPIAMTMALTYRCNLRCRYCQIWKDAEAELSTRQVLTAIDELTDAGMCRLGLTGGEPLLRDDIATVVSHAVDRGLFTSIFTNGALVPEHLPTVRQLSAVLISLDGPQEVHDAMRGQGAHAAALRAIELIAGEGVPVWTNTVLTDKNIDQVPYILDLAQRFGALAAFQPVFEHTYSVGADRVAALRADEARYDQVIDRLIALKRSGAPLLNSTAFFEYVRTPIWERNARQCLAGLSYGAVSPDGRVAPCPVMLQAERLPDGCAIGFAEAFRRSARFISCKGCFCIATVESDLLFSLNLSAVTNTVRHVLRRRPARTRSAPPTSTVHPSTQHDCEAPHAAPALQQQENAG